MLFVYARLSSEQLLASDHDPGQYSSIRCDALTNSKCCDICRRRPVLSILRIFSFTGKEEDRLEAYGIGDEEDTVEPSCTELGTRENGNKTHSRTAQSQEECQ